MARKVIWSVHASEQLKDTLSYWNKRNGSNYYSNRLYQESKMALVFVANFPRLGKSTNDPNVRRIVVDKKYGIYFSIETDAIYVKLWRSLKMNPNENDYEK
ncbi:hypothetical protein N9L92_05125 [Saprospiraceae bacterium]|nr:hypothetical protein [Saprospiraceae bacterium]